MLIGNKTKPGNYTQYSMYWCKKGIRVQGNRVESKCRGKPDQLDF